MQMAMDLGSTVFVKQSRALQTRIDQTETLKTVRVPTLIMCGEHDQLCSVQSHEFMCGLIPSASLCVIPDAGHLTPLEQPELTNEALKQWLNA